MVIGHTSLSRNGGNKRKFASNLLMSLSGSGHSIRPCQKKIWTHKITPRKYYATFQADE